jgi:hypothetical protein
MSVECITRWFRLEADGPAEDGATDAPRRHNAKGLFADRSIQAAALLR